MVPPQNSGIKFVTAYQNKDQNCMHIHMKILVLLARPCKPSVLAFTGTLANSADPDQMLHNVCGF